ncbi:hypothetical protein CYMTET_37389 [Cymbomonas tetramitiformis]|uniref:Uncharacterized protein n=1 Tax=Cymbomonas tetramitiformis TaxID=36881 RepID=A0AAE0F7K6_9CHLO|nr:hypothetical protein CYMTET_37389 [Cymbomonas tetramitiformis]
MTSPVCARQLAELVSAMVDLRSAQPDFVVSDGRRYHKKDRSKQVEEWEIIPNTRSTLTHRGAFNGTRTSNATAFARKHVFRDTPALRTRAFWKAQRANLCTESTLFLYKVFVAILQKNGVIIDGKSVANIGIAATSLKSKSDHAFINPRIFPEGQTNGAMLIETNPVKDDDDAVEAEHSALTLRTVDGTAYHIDITAAQFDETDANSPLGYPLLVVKGATPAYANFEVTKFQEENAAAVCARVDFLSCLCPHSHPVNSSVDLTLKILSDRGDTNDWSAVWKTYFRARRERDA